MLNILFTASECTPFIKTGGLADVIGSLPAALKNEQHCNINVILPFYEDIKLNQSETDLVASFNVPVGWRNQEASLHKLSHNNITYYFIKNSYYFGRKGTYGYFDDGERFVFFSRAVIESLPFLSFTPDIIHSHDWQTGLVPAFLKILQPITGVKCVFTIHNIQYQGIMPANMFNELLNIGSEHMFGMEWDGLLNCMKAGIYHADLLTTVSPSYAKEIQYSYYGEGLDPLLRKRQENLYGVVNGIDTSEFNPKTDTSLYKNYYHSSDDKKENKKALQKEANLPVSSETPVIGIISRLVEQKGLSLVTCMLHEILQEDVQLIILGTGDNSIEDTLLEAAHTHKEQIVFYNFFNEALARRIYAGSDFFLMPSRFEPCGLGQLIALRYETAPIVRETGGLRDTVVPFNEYTKEGNGFSFTNYNAHDMFHAIQYALNTYHTPELWDNILNNIYASSISWHQSAKKYLSMYEEL
ncbi:glycogen synthase GlgA [Alteribacillus sp. YIM 98480]|uniref:glycogen synthase GlgA n=1 Tax=Alteribacillus sp. YIM 98480 TaxID=2606599 RepID=UPI00351B7F2E